MESEHDMTTLTPEERIRRYQEEERERERRKREAERDARLKKERRLYRHKYIREEEEFRRQHPNL